MSTYPLSAPIQASSTPRNTRTAAPEKHERAQERPLSGPPGRGFGIHHRLVYAVNGVFLLTMAVFLSVSFAAETRRSLDLTLDHLRETVGVLGVGPLLNASEILEAERRLSSRTEVPHRILLVDPRDGQIRRASDPLLIGQPYDSRFRLEADRLHEETPIRLSKDIEWLSAEAPFSAGGADLRIVLLRARSGREAFLRSFVALHGIHVLVTVALFTMLLQLTGTWYVKRPIAHLAQLIGRLERGEARIRAAPLHDDELGWLEERFSRMAERLQITIRRMVRAEKQASASAVVFRIVRELEAPLKSLDRHTVYLEALATNDPELRRIEGEIREDRRAVLTSLRRLVEIESTAREAFGSPMAGASSEKEESS